MDAEKLAIDLLLKGMTQDQQTAALESIKESVAQAKAIQKQRIGENVQVVVQALKKIESDIKARYDETGKTIEKRVASIKDGNDGTNGINGKAGKDGRPGRDGAIGPRGNDGRDGLNGRDGENGVSVTDAHIDFDGSLIISLSSGQVLNVGEVVAPDLAEKIKVITNGGGTSQQVLDTLASLQTQINNIYPSQTGNAGKFLTTNGTAVSWANVAGGLSYQGTWNASTNTPTLASGTGINGYYYITGVAGSTNLDGITDWQIGDWLMFNGTVWQKIDQSNLVTSVNGQTGAVSLSTTNISEGANQYFTTARVRSSVSAGTGISYNSGTGVVTNAAPDQTVSLAAGTGISTSGTYPNFTVANTAPDQTVVLTAGTGISTSGTYPNFTVANTAPDRVVALTGAGTTTVTGTYPNFTISSADSTTGTVTSVAGTGTVNGISLSGAVTSAGNLTLGGALSGVSLTTQVAGTLPVANGGTGVTTSTGSGNTVLSTSPTLVTPVLGAATATSLQGILGNVTPAAATVTDLNYTGTLTGGTGKVNLGSGQLVKDASGNVGIGTSSPDSKLVVANTASSSPMAVFSGDDFSGNTSGLVVTYSGASLANYRVQLGVGGYNGYISLRNGANNEAVRITSASDSFLNGGNLLVGTTSAIDSLAKVQCVSAVGNIPLLTYAPTSSNQIHVSFRNNNGGVGSIFTNGSSTSFNTSSDYRLKEAITPMQGALARVAALKPCTYKWKVDGSDGEGFIAHELQAVVPDCVTGEKDAVDSEGKPQYQGIDTSFLVATLTAAIQELKAIVDTQAARITALEAK